MTAETTLALHHSLDDIAADEWDRLAGKHPFTRHAFLQALHQSGCASPQTGWTPLCLTLTREDKLVGALLLYLKRHSRGEYVFDHAWAEAYQRNGLLYYPKLLGAVPFTPVSGPRLLAHDAADKVALARAAIVLAQQNKLSSLHILFPSEEDTAAFEAAGYMIREGVQFHWRNAGYATMAEFLGYMAREKRKKILQDRRRVEREGISFEWIRGQDITAQDLDFFYECYALTYFQHGNPPYLTRDAFAGIHAALPDDLLLIIARDAGERVAVALNVVDGQTVYGRYWGATRFVSGLHFETCYMQAIEYCIVNGLACFEGGAQGEHKIARGLLPVITRSAHWIGDPRFAAAISEFLDSERTAVGDYRDELDTHSPFKN